MVITTFRTFDWKSRISVSASGDGCVESICDWHTLSYSSNWYCPKSSTRIVPKTASTAKSRMEIIVPQLMKHYGVVEKLKASNQLEWVRQMNSCVAQAEEAIRLYYHRILILDWFCAIIRLKLVWRDWNVERTYILRHLYFAKRYAN